VLVLVLVLVVLAVVVAFVVVCLPRRRVVKIRDRVSVRCAALTYAVTTRNVPSKSEREFHVSPDSGGT
jgi:predicted Holliday junction resolvase-like endonuclease